MLLDQLTLVAPDGSSVVLSTAADATYFLDDYQLSPVPYDANVVERPTTGGAYDFRPRARSRQVTVRGTICGNTREHARDLARALTRVVARYGTPTHQVALRWVRDGVAVEMAAKLTGEPTTRPHPEAGYKWIEFELTFVAADPLAYKTTPKSVSLSSSPGTSTSNAGELVWPTFTVTGPTSGTTTEVTVGNSTIGQRVRLTGLALTAGQTLTVVCAPGREHCDIDGLGVMDKLDDDSRFPHVRAGTNRLYLTFDAGTGTAGQASYTEGWAD